MKPFRPFIPPLAVMLMAASGSASAQGALIERSEIRFSGKQMGHAVEGKFRKWRAHFDFRPKDLDRSKADFEIELASVDLANEEREHGIRHRMWFHTAKFPVARFTSTAMKNLGSDRYEIAGQLSLKGVTRDVVIPVALRRDASGNSVAEGKFAFKRLDYGIGAQATPTSGRGGRAL